MILLEASDLLRERINIAIRAAVEEDVSASVQKHGVGDGREAILEVQCFAISSVYVVSIKLNIVHLCLDLLKNRSESFARPTPIGVKLEHPFDSAG